MKPRLVKAALPPSGSEQTARTLDADVLRRCVRATRVAIVAQQAVASAQQAVQTAQQAFYAALETQHWTIEKAGLDPKVAWRFDDEALTATPVPPQQGQS